MSSRHLLIAALLALPGLVACGRAPADELPATVAAAVTALAAECSGVGGTPHTADAVKRADLNGDAREDYVLFAGWIHCENAASVYGDRTKSLAVFPGGERGSVGQPFTDMVYDASIESAVGAAKLWLTVAGGGCGRPPAPDFASESFCDRPLAWSAQARRFDYAPVDTVRMIE
jgi:hypothetical protein